MREEIEVLEHHSHSLAKLVYVCLLIRDGSAVKQYRARRRDLEKIKGTKERGFAGAGWTDDDHYLTLVDVDGDVIQRLYRAVVIVLLKVLNGN